MSYRCVWYQCYNPPLPRDNDNENRLNLLWDPKQPVDFNTDVKYSCAGFSTENDTFFEHDRDLEFVSIQCQDDGYFKVPDQWFKCAKGVTNYFIIELQC